MGQPNTPKSGRISVGSGGLEGFCPRRHCCLPSFFLLFFIRVLFRLSCGGCCLIHKHWHWRAKIPPASIVAVYSITACSLCDFLLWHDEACSTTKAAKIRGQSNVPRRLPLPLSPLMRSPSVPQRRSRGRVMKGGRVHGLFPSSPSFAPNLNLCFVHGQSSVRISEPSLLIVALRAKAGA